MMFQQNLQRIRKQRQLSQEQLAEKLGISRQAVAKWENGLAYPDIENLIRLSEVLCVTIDSLMKEGAECFNREQEDKEWDTDELLDFVLEAKKNTYAAKGKEEENPCRPGSHDFAYQKGAYAYLDSYVGGRQFAGEEVIRNKEENIWVMNYMGRTLADSFSGDFLKSALMNCSKENPFRGPALYQKGEYTYHSRYEGDFSWFDGKEEIFYKGDKVYECYFHGGLLR
ncbi:MAG: helix-turn-helix domain-containing protein [Lachnospiraceae bacterium]|nr:helix-turn-helix domain-containing protein [Lachnospiraceae bacterium]